MITTRILLTTLITGVLTAATPSPDRVVIVANADDPDSLAVARHYLAARKIPERNLVALSLPKEESIDWTRYIERLRNPLLARLVEKELLTGTIDNTPDSEGRTRFELTENKIDFLVLCRGVPLKISHDQERLLAREYNPPAPEAIRVNHASVDSEIALLPLTGTPLSGFVPNPWYADGKKPDAERRRKTIRVARLDGPSMRDAKGLVNLALDAEREGLMGRAYIDLGGPHPKGDAMLTRCAELCEAAGYETDRETTPALLARGARFDAPVFYFGWYSADIDGVVNTLRFRFPPGAIAIHIHSFSAKTLRDANAGWTGPLIARGVTATVGNVEEPYLEFTHNPSIFLEALLRGATAGEAAAESIPVLSWQGVFIGDPLYRPFKHDLPAQLQDLRDRPVDAQRAYAVLRMAKVLDARNERDRAQKLLSESFAAMPVLPLARALLERELSAGKKPTFDTRLLAPVAEDPGLLLTTAEKLFAAGQSEEAGRLLTHGVSHDRALTPAAAELARQQGFASLADRLAPAAAKPR